MADVQFLSPKAGQCIHSLHAEVLSRAARGIGVVSGNAVMPTDPPSMAVVVGSGTIRLGSTVLNVSSETVSITESHETLYRMDVIYRNTSGTVCVLEGEPGEIVNPKNQSSWTGYTSPSPPDDIPNGVILAIVYVPAAAQTIQQSFIWEIAAGVEDPVLTEDIVTSISSPGDNVHVPSEAAVCSFVESVASTKVDQSAITTILGNPGSNSLIPSEKAVRDVFNALGVTNGNSHDHVGGDGAQIDHRYLSNLSSDDHPQYLNIARHDLTSRHTLGTVVPHDNHAALLGLDADDHPHYLNTARHDTTARHAVGTVIPVVTSVGNPGSDTNIPSEKAVRSAINAHQFRSLQVHLDGGNSTIPTGRRLNVVVPLACTITAWYLLANTSGSISITVSKCTFSGYPTGSSILTPSLSSAQKNSATGLSISCSQNDILMVTVNSCSTINWADLALMIEVR